AARQPARPGDVSRRDRVGRRGPRDRRRLVPSADVRAAAGGELAGRAGALPGKRRTSSPRGGHLSEVAGALRGIPAPEDQWDQAAAEGLDVLAALVHRSNLLGADRALANQGGGNTSAKGTARDHTGKEQRVLWVKGSGTDLASITEAGFAALRLDEILPL